MDICGDNRFEIIAKAKQALLDSTNIDTSPDEMAVLDEILFRCWQMGWLDKYDPIHPGGWTMHSMDGTVSDIPHRYDGNWIIVTDGKRISVERIKKDCYDHFYPNGRWFELEDVVAWMPLPKPYKGGDDE